MIFSTRILFILTIVSIFHIKQLWGECNVCSATTKMACVSVTQYQACVNNVPSGTVNSCPNDYICSTTTAATCVSSVAGIPATCGSCNVCDANGNFACTGVNTYALCLGTNVPSSSTGSCAGSLVCDINLPQICGNPLTGSSATCPSTISSPPCTPFPTLPSTVPTYAQYVCQTIRVNARFSLPTTMDNTCRKYIYCFLTAAGTWSGQIYTCAGSTYFDPHSRYCVATKPAGC